MKVSSSGSNTAAQQILWIDKLYLLARAPLRGRAWSRHKEEAGVVSFSFGAQDNRNFEIGPAMQYKERNPV